MPMFWQFPLACAIRKRAFGVTVESLGSLALHRELQTKLPHLQFPSQMELRQDVIHQAPTARFFLAHLGRDYMVVAAGREPAETCGQTMRGTRLWCPLSVQAYISLLRRALLNLQPAVESPELAGHGWFGSFAVLLLP